jgi:hypothetical protein
MTTKTEKIAQVPMVKNSWLIQRLEALTKRDNPFNFGGGLRNGGLSDDAMTLLRGVFSFAYMGSAEFEFGAVPKAFQGLANDQKDLVAYSFEIPLAKVKAPWREPKDTPVPEGSATIYVLCRAQHRQEVTTRITGFAGGKDRLKGATMLSGVLRPGKDDSYVPGTQGWLELDNGYLFFTDETMWTQTCDLFGVTA